jgi:apolipoprotein N-acyltransferase
LVPGWTLPGWTLVALASGLSAAALPPVGWGGLGFVAPIGFLWACLPGVTPVRLRVVFLLAMLQWMLVFHFIRLPHWAGWLGWPVLAGYFAVYQVLLVAATRRLVQRARWSPVVAFPLVWVALEWTRSTVLTGFPIGLLGHSLYQQPFWIQTADLAGELTVSFLMVVVAAGVAQWAAAEFGWLAAAKAPVKAPAERLGSRLWGIRICRARVAGGLAAVGALALMWGYGTWTYSRYQTPVSGDGSVAGLKIGLIQGAQDVQFGLSNEAMVAEARASYQTHRDLTLQARSQQVELVVWAESMFPVTDILPFDLSELDRSTGSADADSQSRPEPQALVQLRQELPWQVRETTGTGPADLYPYSQSLPLIVGMRSYDPVADHDFNAAVQFDAQGEVAQRYFKTHLVPFGEYLPAGDWFPQLYQLAPMSRGLTPGDGVRTFQVQGLRLVPTICYESVMGGLVRSYVQTLNRPSTGNPQGAPTRWDALLNLSNDGWFWGSSALDLHLASNVFRAVENRATHLVVCNTGISAEIAPNGVIRQQAAKRQATLLVVTVPPRPDDWKPWWWQVGDAPWWICGVVVVVGLWLSRRPRPL